MKTRKQKTPVSKRARLQPTKRRAARASQTAARGKKASKTIVAARVQEEQSLTLAAECTVAEADALKAELARRVAEAGPVIVDLSALQRIDTAGLQLLAAFVRDRRTAGRTVAWRGWAPALEAAAGLLGLKNMLELPREADR